MLSVVICMHQTVQAHVYISEGKNVLHPRAGLTQRATLVVNARGTSGACFDYVWQTFDDLASIGIDDPKVTALWKAVCDLRGTKNLVAGNVRF